MKIIKKIFYFLAGMLIVFCALIIVCAFRPEVAGNIASFLYTGRNKPAMEEVQGSLETEIVARLPGDSGKKQNTTDMVETEDASEDRITDMPMPGQDSASVPETVSGRNGYQEIQDEEEQIDEETARQLQNRLGTGNTGDGLEFDAVYYPYYAMLNEKEQHLYRQIYANAGAGYDAFAPVESVSPEQLKNIFSAVYNDHPELFWMDTAYACKYTGTGTCVEIDLQFNRTMNNLDSAKAAFDENAGYILEEAGKLPNDYEKEKYVHDALIEKIVYNASAEMNQSAYSAMVNGETVCAGYARAFQYLLQQLGIPCYYCTGYAEERHAWNIVALDDGYYHVDVTWDDEANGSYDFFNKTDADYADSHFRQDMSVNLPVCNGQTYRNLEPDSRESGLRNLADTGIEENQVISGLQAYYDDCYSQIVQKGMGNYTFYNVLEGEQLLDEWYGNYQAENYKQGYLEAAMTALNATSCSMSLQVEQLQGGKYLVGHEISIW